MDNKDSELVNESLTTNYIVTYNKDTKSLLFTTSLTVNKELDSILSVFNEKENIELMIDGLSKSSLMYLEFLKKNMTNGEFVDILKSLVMSKN